MTVTAHGLHMENRNAPSKPLPFLRALGQTFPTLAFVYTAMAAAVSVVTVDLARRLIDAEPVTIDGAGLEVAVREAFVRTAIDAADAYLVAALLLPAHVAAALLVCATLTWIDRARALTRSERIDEVTKEAA